MKPKNLLSSTIALAMLATALLGCATEQEQQTKLAATAKISRADAEKTALTKAPGGTIKEGELEKEDGKLIWSFDIATPGSKDITEVAVDAITEQIIAVETETPDRQAKEAAKDAAKEKKD